MKVYLVLLDKKLSILREVSTCPRGPKAILFRLAQFLLEALMTPCAVMLNIANNWGYSKHDTAIMFNLQ